MYFVLLQVAADKGLGCLCNHYHSLMSWLGASPLADELGLAQWLEIQFFQLKAELAPWVSVFTGGFTSSHFPSSLSSSQKHIPRDGIWKRVKMFIVFFYMSINIGVLLKPTDNASMSWRGPDGARLPGCHGTNANLYCVTSIWG